MKPNYIFLCLLFILPIHINCQVWEWTEPVPITDSLSDNRNAIVLDLDFYAGQDYYVIWEKSYDTLSTNIFSRRYYFQEYTMPLVSGDFHAINPCTMRIDSWNPNPEDTTFFLFYLSDQDGDFDIYYKSYNQGGMSDPVQFTFTPGDEMHLQSNEVNGITWEYEGKIMYAKMKKTGSGPYYMTDPLVIDSGNCHNPVVEPIPDFTWDGGYLAWEKVNGEGSQVMISQWNYGGGWNAPEVIYDTGFNTNLRFEESSWSEVAATLCWERVDASGNHKMLLYDPWEENFGRVDLEQQMDFHPTVFNIFVGVSDLWFFAQMSFIQDVDGQPDVFGGYQETQPSSYVNITNSSTIEANPHLWNGYMYYGYQDVINVWETFVNDHWQLYTAYIDVPISGGVQDKATGSLSAVQARPNPFKDVINVTLNSNIEGVIDITLINSTGQRIAAPDPIYLKKGQNSFCINPERDTGLPLQPGIYFLQLDDGRQPYTIKLIKTL